MLRRLGCNQSEGFGTGADCESLRERVLPGDSGTETEMSHNLQSLQITPNSHREPLTCTQEKNCSRLTFFVSPSSAGRATAPVHPGICVQVIAVIRRSGNKVAHFMNLRHFPSQDTTFCSPHFCSLLPRSSCNVFSLPGLCGPGTNRQTDGRTGKSQAAAVAVTMMGNPPPSRGSQSSYSTSSPSPSPWQGISDRTSARAAARVYDGDLTVPVELIPQTNTRCTLNSQPFLAPPPT